VLTCTDLQPNRDYYILFTTSGGLYRYDMDDIVRVVDFYRDVPLIEFVRKGHGMTSLAGENLVEPQVTAATIAAAEALGLGHAIRHFTAVPAFGTPPRYTFLIELTEEVLDDRLQAFAERLDREIGEENVEYEARRESLRLDPPLLRIVAPGTYDAYRQERVLAGAPEAQVQVPHLTPEREFGQTFTVISEIEQVAR
jgi:hypothetical protein